VVPQRTVLWIVIPSSIQRLKDMWMTKCHGLSAPSQPATVVDIPLGQNEDLSQENENVVQIDNAPPPHAIIPPRDDYSTNSNDS